MNNITIEETSDLIDYPQRHPTAGAPPGRTLFQPLASAALTIPLLFGLSGCDNVARMMAKPEATTAASEPPKVAAQSAAPAAAPAHNPLTDWMARVFGQPVQRPAAPEAKPKVAAQPTAPEAAPEPPPAPIPAPQEKPKPGKLYEWDGQGRKLSRIVINTDEQKARFYVGDEQVGWTTVASGLSKYPTPAGHFEVIEKAANKRSNLYGKVLGMGGRVLSSNAKAGTGQFPDGARFEGASMPYYMRLTYDGVGLHAGPIPHPGRPASHGCIRLPSQLAPVLFEHVNIGTKVSIVGAGPDYGNYAARQRAQAAERQAQAQQRREAEERARPQASAQADTEPSIQGGAIATETMPSRAVPKLAMVDPFVEPSAAPARPPAAKPRERTPAAPAPRRTAEAAVARPKVPHHRPAPVPAAKPAGTASKNAVAQAEPVSATATPSQDQAAPSPAPSPAPSQATPAANPAPNAPAAQPVPTIAKAEASPANPGQHTAPQAAPTPATPVQPAPEKAPAPQAKPAAVNPPSPPAAPAAKAPQVVAEAPAASKPAAAPAPAQPANATPDKPSGT